MSAVDCASITEVFETPYTNEKVARGVRARCNMHRGQLVETAHCILVPRLQYDDHFRHTALEHYLFHTKQGDYLLALGLGSMYNHSRWPSLDYRIDAAAQVIRYSAARDIAAGEELTIYYGDHLWFEDATAGNAPGGSPAVSSDEEDDTKMLSRLQL